MKPSQITWTDNGYVVTFQPTFLVDKLLPVHPATLLIDFNVKSKVEVRRLLSLFPTEVTTILSHEPIILPEHERLMFSKVQTYEDIYLSQRLEYKGEHYIDDFGFYVYCYSFLTEHELLKDTRYEN